MELILGPRRVGKTQKLIELSGETGHVIVCSNTKECSHIAKKASNLNLKIPYPITYESFLKRDYEGKEITGFLIDNMDYLLRYISGQIPVMAITMNIPFKMSVETGIEFPGVLDINSSKFSKEDIKDIKKAWANRPPLAITHDDEFNKL